MEMDCLAVTMGDPCGIGPEIVAKTLAKYSPEDRDRLIVIGPLAALEKAFSLLKIAAPRFCSIHETGTNGVKVIDVKIGGKFPPGKVCREGGAAAIAAIETAHRLCVERKCFGMVTAPIGKKAIKMAGSRFSGHTDMLESLSGASSTKMAMVHGKFRVVLTTLHVPYRKVPGLLSTKTVYDTFLLAHETFKSAKNPSPRIAVAGLNPHAGEDGLFGEEEEKIILPAIDLFSSVNARIEGPFPADSMFKSDMRKKFDVFIAHTHDQGLIAIKTLFGIKCVNVTLGLPYIRTSVGHGTAYDIAGKGVADPSGLGEAVREAINLFGRGGRSMERNARLF